MHRFSQARKPGRTHNDRRIVWIEALLLTAAAGTIGCGAQGPDPGAVEIARVDGRPILLREFEPMLRANAAGSAEELSDVVKSRLLDQFLERQVLLAEARKRGIEVADQELDESLARDGQAGASDRVRDQQRVALMVDKLVRRIVEESAEITPENEKRYYEEHLELFHQTTVLVLRQILLDDPQRAAEARAELVEMPERFAEMAQRISLSPDQGVPRAYPVDELPREAVALLRDLEPGAVSSVVEMPPSYLIFRLEERRPERRVPLEEARAAIRARLQESQGNSLLARLLMDLKTRMGVQMYKGELPFRYIQEEPA